MDGAHAASCEEMSTALSKAEVAAYKGLQQCIETVISEVSCFFWGVIYKQRSLRINAEQVKSHS